MARTLGKPHAMSVAGGIDAWSLSADNTVPRYERPARLQGCEIAAPLQSHNDDPSRANRFSREEHTDATFP